MGVQTAKTEKNESDCIRCEERYSRKYLNVCVEHRARRLLMVGLAEAAAEKTMVRSQAGIRGAFVVETASGGKSGLAVQLEGSSFETVWQLKEGMPGGLMVMEKVMFYNFIIQRDNFNITLFKTFKLSLNWISISLVTNIPCSHVPVLSS